MVLTAHTTAYSVPFWHCFRSPYLTTFYNDPFIAFMFNCLNTVTTLVSHIFKHFAMYLFPVKFT